MPNSNLAIELSAQPLPNAGRTRSGFTFNPDEDRWIIPHPSGVRYFYFSKIKASCDPDIVNALKSTLCWYLRHKSVPHANNMLVRFEHFITKTYGEGVCSVIRDTDILNYKSNLDKMSEWYLGSLRGFLKTWSAFGYLGIDPSAIRLLSKLTISGNRKGWAVLTMDPEEGPFTNREMVAIHAAVNTAFAKEPLPGEKPLLTNRLFSLIWLFMATGTRPSQAASLKVGDFSVNRLPDSSAEYVIKIPRAKQRNQLGRTDFRTWKLIPPVGRVVEGWCKQLTAEYCEKIDGDMKLAELPLFPSWDRKRHDAGFSYHTDTRLIWAELGRLFKKLGIISHRTKKPIRITPTRFRYTVGTRAAIEKAGAAVIADLLDHSDMQNVMVYVKNSPEILEELNAELSDDLDPLAQAFRGEVVLFEPGSSKKPCRIILYPGVDLEKSAAGRCQSGRRCTAKIPEACYPCDQFHAFSEGPHEEMLARLEADRAKELAEGGDMTVAGAIDLVIDAVKSVIKKCHMMKGGK